MIANTINPFFAARTKRFSTPARVLFPSPIFAKLPVAPINASPVPHLTSLYHDARAGEYGNRAYPGNCGGNLIKDLLLYFRPRLPKPRRLQNRHPLPLRRPQPLPNYPHCFLKSRKVTVNGPQNCDRFSR